MKNNVVFYDYDDWGYPIIVDRKQKQTIDKKKINVRDCLFKIETLKEKRYTIEKEMQRLNTLIDKLKREKLKRLE